MACELCEHCNAPVRADDDVTFRDGYSYHKSCHKCYVCSETDLHDAEIFKGVIFCSGCSQRIFQGCSTARWTKNNKTKRQRSRSQRRRDRTRERRPQQKHQNGVIELAGINLSTDSDSRSHSDDIDKCSRFSKTLALSTELALQVGKEVYESDIKSMKRNSTDMGMTTDVTHELLKQIHCPVVQPAEHKTSVAKTHNKPDNKHVPQNKYISNNALVYSARWRHNPLSSSSDLSLNQNVVDYLIKDNEEQTQENKAYCSDLRIAELGASTEIANMALRKKSELPVILKSHFSSKHMDSTSRSNLNPDSGVSGEDEEHKQCMDPAYSSLDESETQPWVDRRIGNIWKIPYKSFKRNILNRSSIVSMSMDDEDRRFLGPGKAFLKVEGFTTGSKASLLRRIAKKLSWHHVHFITHALLKKFKMLFYEEVTEHQKQGIKRLHSTINRRKTPYRLGWLQLVSNTGHESPVYYKTKVSASMSTISAIFRPRLCKHFKASHSYRCMRAHVMRLAGPTKSELACFRRTLKRLVAPQYFRFITNVYRKKYAAIMTSQGCGSEAANSETKY